MKRITYNDLPTAVAELLDKVNNLEKLVREIKEIRHAEKGISKTKKAVSEDAGAAHEEPSLVMGNGSDVALNIDEASLFTGISRSNLYSYVKNKRIPFVKEKNGRLKFSKSELGIWAKQYHKIERKPKSRVAKLKAENPKVAFSQDPDHITLREVVKLVGKHPSAVYYQLRKKDIPVVEKIGSRVFYSRTRVLEAFKEEVEK
jgi:predicted DNA-binding transcriptional regulator AlpA